MCSTTDALHKRRHETRALLGNLVMERDQLDQRIDAVKAELRAVQRAADAVPPNAGNTCSDEGTP